MLHQQAYAAMEKGYRPHWSWRAVWLAAAITILLYMALPYLERLSTPEQSGLTLRQVTTVQPPVPVQPPPEPVPPEEARAPRPPELQPPLRTLSLPPANLGLQMGMGAINGDFAWGFALQDFGGDVAALVFELGELDEPPRPLVQLRPLYPPQARMRQIEGYVTVEFVVGTDGAVVDPVVTEAQPLEVFDQAALRAVARWRFSPGVRAGEAVAVRVRQRVEFRLQ
jgi:periplasmic protein TonB